MKKLVLFIALMSIIYCCPVYGQDDSNAINEVTTTQFESALEDITDTVTKYTTTEVNIRSEPNTDAEILGQSNINSSFDTVVEINGWTMIVTNDGYAYMKSNWLVDEPVEIHFYTEEDLEILTRLLTGECHTYPDEEQILVGSVILNRVKSPLYPNTVKGVVFQKGQYSCIGDGNYYREPTENNRINAKWLLEHGSILPENVVYQSGGKQGSGVYLKTDYHYYCYR